MLAAQYSDSGRAQGVRLVVLMRLVDPVTPEAVKKAQRPDKSYPIEEGLSHLLHDAIASQDGLYCAALCGTPALCKLTRRPLSGTPVARRLLEALVRAAFRPHT